MNHHRHIGCIFRSSLRQGLNQRHADPRVGNRLPSFSLLSSPIAVDQAVCQFSQLRHSEKQIVGVPCPYVISINENGKPRPWSLLAFDMRCYGDRKYIGSYAAAMGGLDAVVFTAGIGENSSLLREKVSEGLGFLGAHFDPSRNQVRGKEAEISAPGSKVKILVVPTNEELVIARDTRDLVGKR